MNKPAKFVLVGLTTIAISAVASSVFAGSPGCRNMEGGMMSQGGPSGGDKAKFAKFIEKRQTELHKKLNLTAEQEPAWNTFTEKMKATLPQGRPNREEMSKLSTPERLDKMLARMKEGEKKMEARATTIKEFYAVLTPEQRKVFDEQSPMHGRRSR